MKDYKLKDLLEKLDKDTWVFVWFECCTLNAQVKHHLSNDVLCEMKIKHLSREGNRFIVEVED